MRSEERAGKPVHRAHQRNLVTCKFKIQKKIISPPRTRNKSTDSYWTHGRTIQVIGRRNFASTMLSACINSSFHYRGSSISTKAKPGGFLATHTSRTGPYLANASSIIVKSSKMILVQVKRFSIMTLF